MHDEAAMTVALSVADRSRRIAPPWPHVGCAIVAEGTVVGTGATDAYHQGRHAERNALAAAGDRARGATMYTTLEPCCHYGNQPPCTDAIIAAGIVRVVTALVDPDHHVAGQGFAALRAAGIVVDVGVHDLAAQRQLGAYLHHRRTGRSACVVKTANSIDGYVAAADGSSQWITGPAARRNVHALRADSQAIVVGAGTALADQPSLTVRELPVDDDIACGEAPLRVLLDAHGRVPAVGPLFDASLAATLVISTERADATRVTEWNDAGAEVVFVNFASATTGRGVDLVETLSLLGERSVLQAMIEGGAALHGALLVEDLVDQLTIYLGNTLLGSHGLPTLAHDGPPSIDEARRWQLVDVVRLDDDVRLDYRRDRN